MQTVVWNASELGKLSFGEKRARDSPAGRSTDRGRLPGSTLPWRRPSVQSRPGPRPAGRAWPPAGGSYRLSRTRLRVASSVSTRAALRSNSASSSAPGWKKVIRNSAPRPLGTTRAGTVQDTCGSRKS